MCSSDLIRKVARKILEGLNFDVDEAEDGAGALERCRAQMPDAVLLDRNLPNMVGPEFLRQLRREVNGGKPVIVYCVIENDVARITEAVNAGANEYLVKPFDRESVSSKFAQAGLI